MNRAAKLLCRILVVLMALAPLQSVRAEMIAVDSTAAARDEAVQALKTLGIPEQAARERVGAMTESEAAAVASYSQTLPAGGNAAFAFLGVILFLAFIVYQTLHPK